MSENPKDAEALYDYFNKGKGWNNPSTLSVINSGNVVTFSIVNNFCSFPFILDEIADACRELRIGV